MVAEAVPEQVYVGASDMVSSYHRSLECCRKGHRCAMPVSVDLDDAYGAGLRPCHVCYSPAEVEAAKSPIDRWYEAAKARLVEWPE